MKALYYPEWGRLEVAEMLVPEVAADEVLVRVHACGICGSELETFKARSARRTPPLVMGHEFCGEIAGVGNEVTGWQVGDRVVSNSLVPCGTCVRCGRGDTHLCAKRQVFGMHRAGAFAEYVNVPARILLPWADGVPAEMACLAEPLGNGVHVVELVRFLRPRKVAVIGAGPIGLMCQIAMQELLGAQVMVTDLDKSREAVARELGAFNPSHPWLLPTQQVQMPPPPAPEFILSEAKDLNERRGDFDIDQLIKDWTDGEGVDVVIDAVGSAATKRQSLEWVRPGGAAVWIGLHGNDMQLSSYDITLPEKFVYGTYAAKIDDLRVALDLMAGGKVKTESLVSVYPLINGVDAFQDAMDARCIKAVLKMLD
jgi:threonine dehydrogenase-like Zn-dependent dehydrogenase